MIFEKLQWSEAFEKFIEELQTTISSSLMLWEANKLFNWS